jgi:hypothetical protein
MAVAAAAPRLQQVSKLGQIFEVFCHVRSKNSINDDASVKGKAK